MTAALVDPHFNRHELLWQLSDRHRQGTAYCNDVQNVAFDFPHLSKNVLYYIDIFF